MENEAYKVSMSKAIDSYGRTESFGDVQVATTNTPCGIDDTILRREEEGCQMLSSDPTTRRVEGHTISQDLESQSLVLITPKKRGRPRKSMGRVNSIVRNRTYPSTRSRGTINNVPRVLRTEEEVANEDEGHLTWLQGQSMGLLCDGNSLAVEIRLNELEQRVMDMIR